MSGVVQGVGFRPFVYRLARALGLVGSIRNDGSGVAIEVQGDTDALERFVERLRSQAPQLATIDRVVATRRPLVDESAFAIGVSEGGPLSTRIGHDAAICDDCLAELFDPLDRRHRHAFAHCTACGPRYTITRKLPYDRVNTSLAGFPLCADCASEYADPADRRFHAEANCCPRCGPRLVLYHPDGEGVQAGDPIAAAWAILQSGGTVALKGMGGYHLACDATDAAAVTRLRARKQRDARPFAVMVANVASARAFAHVGSAEASVLQSGERPIVLLRKDERCDERLAEVAPGLDEIGVLLPYTPLHYLLFHEAAGRPAGTAWLARAQPLVLLMTSANDSGAPILVDDGQARRALRGVADAILQHDRAIVVRCEDSVVRVRGRPQGTCASCGDADGGDLLAVGPGPAPLAPLVFLRRGRGYAPNAIRLVRSGPSTVAFGANYKNTVALTRGDEAFVSPHIGDLDSVEACAALDSTLGHLRQLLGIEPEQVAHDLHPDLPATRLAMAFAAQHGVRAIAVQHHHAHIAAVAAEHRFDGPLLGIALDGVGAGSDGHAWGGELLLVDAATFERRGHLRELALPGGDRAAREPWRMAASALHALGRNDEIAQRFAGQPNAPGVARMLAGGLNAPPTSSAGRWFDAAAGLLGVCPVARFEAQAPMRLQVLASTHGPVAPITQGFHIDEDGTLDLLPLLARLADLRDAAFGAALFHATLVDALSTWIEAASAASGIRTVALGGGCFLNRILADGLEQSLAARGMQTLAASRVPPSDGGLALGQAWVAVQSSY